jgi:predicted kinase
MPAPPAVLLITGIQAAGKSTVAQLVAEQLDRSVHLRGDRFRRMIVTGRADMTPDPGPEAVRQLRLRHQLTAAVADQYCRAGFTVVAQDVILGEHLAEMVRWIRSRPLLVVVLAPEPAAVAAREAGRTKTAYGDFTVADLDAALRRDTPRIGLWLDTTDQTPGQTAAEILRRGPAEAAV